MEVEIISKDTIKPSKPTPTHLKIYKLSSLDQLSPNIYVPILLFYQAPSKNHNQNPVNLSLTLKASLSELLVHYYPFAGKIKDGVHIDCNDQGVLFIEARAKTNLIDTLTLPKLSTLNKLFPEELQWKSSKNSSVLAVQASYFECGGISVGICISHKIADACSIITFLRDWGLKSQSSSVLIDPVLTGTSVFPPNEHFFIPELELVTAKVVTRRYVFHPSKISELKADIISKSKVLINNPTRVEVVTSLIYKCIIQENRKKSCVLAQTVNLRHRMAPSLPRNSIGNVVWYFSLMVGVNDGINLQILVTKMREGLKKLYEFAKNINGEEWLLKVAELEKNSGTCTMDDAYKFSSWCRYPVYEIDFGWGGPIWVSYAEYPYKNNIFLMDTKDGEGIEAWVTLDEELMDILEEDEEFSTFASFNPSISS